MQPLSLQHKTPAFTSRRERPRDGFLLVELLVALILLTVLASVLPMALKGVYNQRQRERFERTAQLELSNAATQLRQADDLTAAVDGYELSEWFRKLYPAAEVELTVAEGATEEFQTVAVTINIRHAWGEAHPPLQQSLTTWIIPQKEAP